MRRTLRLDTLDSRIVPATIGTTPFGVSLNQYGTLTIKGDERETDAHVFVGGDQKIHVALSHTQLIFQGNGITTTDPEKLFDAAQVKKIVFYGEAGNDSFLNDTGIKSLAYGSTGNDDLIGGSGNDTLVGNDGEDFLEGRFGNDNLQGNAGSDTYAWRSTPEPGPENFGTDFITEGAYLDRDTIDFQELEGESGIKLNLGITGYQTVRGSFLKIALSNGAAIEEVIATDNDDVITGNARGNKIDSFDGNDSIVTGSGNDTILSGLGNDTITSNTGNDSIVAGSGNDSVHSGFGNDTILGGDGNDSLFGSLGNDSIVGGIGHDSIDGWTGNDHLQGAEGNDTIYGNSGNDVISGGSGDDYLYGDADQDTVSGDSGDDLIDGGYGNDSLTGGDNNDYLLGGAGTDSMHGGNDDDTLIGGTGKDSLDGGAGYDKLYADQGNETFTNGEAFKITVASGSPQDDSWSCGPNSASRLLRSYGLDYVSYGLLRTKIKAMGNIITQYGLGSPPPTLHSLMKQYRPETQLKSGADFDEILSKLASGRPVLALIGWGENPVPSPNPFKPIDIAPQALHYICLTGYSTEFQKIYYTDTDGVEKSYTFNEFRSRWNWPGDGFLYETLSAMGIKKSTILW